MTLIIRTFRGRTGAGWLLLLLAAALYLLTLDNGFQPYELRGGDLITHQYAQVQARPSNAPGYPIYTMGGWLWFHSLTAFIRTAGVAYPNPIPLLSSYSTLWALLSLWLLYQSACHLTRRPDRPSGNVLLAWLTAAFLAVAYFFWYYATTTEQYSSAVAQTLAIFYLYLLWQDLPRQDPSYRRMALLFGLAFLCGLCLAHMLTVALIVPPLVIVILWGEPSLLRNPRAIGGVLLAAALPLVAYIFIYVRGAAPPEWWGSGQWSSANEWFWSFVSTAQGRAELGWGFEAGRAFFGNGFPELMVQELSLPLLLAGLVGIALAGRSRAFLLYTTLALYLLFCWAYRYGNWFQVILPAYPLVLLGVTVLLDRWQTVLLHARHRTAIRLTWLPPTLLVLAVAWRFAASLPAADSRNRPEDTALKRAALLLDQPLPAPSGLFAAVDDALALQYLTQIGGLHPGVTVVSSKEAGLLLDQGRLVLASADSAPTLRAELPPHVNPALHSYGPDWIAFLGPQARLPDAVFGQQKNKAVQKLTDDIALAGYRAAFGYDPQGAFPAHDTGLGITLYWQLATGDWPDGVSLSVRPTSAGAFLPDPNSQPGAIVQQDRTRPVYGLFEPGQRGEDTIVADGYRFLLPPDVLAGVDGILVILYESKDEGFRNIAEIALQVGPSESPTQ
jgi:hypothetical protein